MLRSLVLSKRLWLPFAAAVLLLVATTLTVSPVLIFLLTMLAVACVLDGATLLWSRGSNLTDYRQ